MMSTWITVHVRDPESGVEAQRSIDYNGAAECEVSLPWRVSDIRRKLVKRVHDEKEAVNWRKLCRNLAKDHLNKEQQ